MTARDRERYSRQILFEPIGASGQRRLLESRAVIVGCGALGSFHAAALARAGVGQLVLVDRDYVEPSNLQRQWLYEEEDAAEALPKAAAAARRLARINSAVKVTPRVADLDAANAAELLLPADVILDGTDNFETRYLINELAVRESTPWIYGAAVGSYAAALPILPGRGACLACLFPAPPEGRQPTCDTAGILNAAAATAAAWQTAAALKILAAGADAVAPRLLAMDVWQGGVQELDASSPDPDCRVCGQRKFDRLSAPVGSRTAALCGRDAVQVHERGRTVDLDDLARRLSLLGTVRSNPYALRFQAAPYELTVFPDGRAIVKGTDDLALARSLYVRYLGA